MINSKTLGGITIGIVIIAIIGIYALNQDQKEVLDDRSIIPTQESSVSISDSVTLTKDNPDYEVDKEGNKKYSISAKDSRTIEE